MAVLTSIDTASLQPGMRFTAPVFFDDGENMFVAEQRSLKSYHFAAIHDWQIHRVVTYGKLIEDTSTADVGGGAMLEELS